jgi:hypothetical protein
MYPESQNLSNAFDSINVKSKEEQERRRQRKQMRQALDEDRRGTMPPPPYYDSRRGSSNRRMESYDRPPRNDMANGPYLHQPYQGKQNDSYIDMSELLASENEKLSRFSTINESRDSLARPRQSFAHPNNKNVMKNINPADQRERNVISPRIHRT